MQLRTFIAKAALFAAFSTACSPWNTVTRPSPNGTHRISDHSAARSNTVTSNEPGTPVYGCSFIEFDGRGGLLDYAQFEDAQATLRELKARSNILLVMYCHGWNNSAQSGDVIRFVGFLKRLAQTQRIRSKHLRVQGVYLAWRGSEYLPIISREDANEQRELSQDFGGDLTTTRWQSSNLSGDLLTLPKYLSYWSIRRRAEFHVSRIPIANVVFRLAFLLRNPNEPAGGKHHRIFVLGHSFGALVLEQAIGQGCVGLLTSDWVRGMRQAQWPFDLVVFLNSAAPSLYAKRLSEFLEQDSQLTERPKVVSITSEGDWATGVFHPLGNALTVFAADLQRSYEPNKEQEKRGQTEYVKAWQYYNSTPGHDRYLINHRIDDVTPKRGGPAFRSADQAFSANLDNRVSPLEFFTTTADGNTRVWRFVDLTGGQNAQRYKTNYWITQVSRAVIRDHNDIWNDQCMEMLAGLFNLVEREH